MKKTPENNCYDKIRYFFLCPNVIFSYNVLSLIILLLIMAYQLLAKFEKVSFELGNDAILISIEFIWAVALLIEEIREVHFYLLSVPH